MYKVTLLADANAELKPPKSTINRKTFLLAVHVTLVKMAYFGCKHYIPFRDQLEKPPRQHTLDSGRTQRGPDLAGHTVTGHTPCPHSIANEYIQT